MENKWFYVKNKDRVGPINEEQLEELIVSGTLQKESYVWKKGLDNWKKIKDMPELSIYLIPEPGAIDKIPFPPELESPLEATATTQHQTNDQVDDQTDSQTNIVANKPFNIKTVSRQEHIFYIKQSESGSEYGPYSLEMIIKLFKQNRVNAKSYIFTPKLENWQYLADLPIYQELFLEEPPIIEETERRISLRRPFVARIFFHDNKNFFEGVCRDISIGGMQVLVSNFPGNQGDEISINVHPENSDHSFVAAGRIARILEGNQGIFIRFSNLSSDASSSILSYLNLDPNFA